MGKDGYKSQLDTASVGIGYVVQPTAGNHENCGGIAHLSSDDIQPFSKVNANYGHNHFHVKHGNIFATLG